MRNNITFKFKEISSGGSRVTLHENMSSRLSGEKMVQAHSKTNYELPPIGVKEVQPDHSWLERKQIQSALDHRKSLLEAERVEKESHLMMADWKPEKHKAAVSRKGKHWETFGHHSDSTDWLFPEEVLFLMEMNCLECFYNEVPLSIQKAYSLLLKSENGCSFNEFRVFSHLCRAGYRVLRHLPNLTVTAYERTIRLDQHLKERKTYGDVSDVEETTPEETCSSLTTTEKLTETGKTQVVNGLAGVVPEKTQLAKQIEKTDMNKVEVPEKCVTRKTKRMKKFVTNNAGRLTKLKLREIRRKNAKLKKKLMRNGGICNVKLQVLQRTEMQALQRRVYYNILSKYKLYQTKNQQEEESHNKNDKFQEISPTHERGDEFEPPSARWRPPVVITHLPENIEMTIGSTPLQSEGGSKEKPTIEIIDIADTSSSEDVETDEMESDSDIEIIQEVRPVVDVDGEEEDEDDIEIIEVPVSKKEIVVEMLSSDSEKEEEEEEDSGSESEKSYDGNWKGDNRSKFVRPPTMSHLTFAAVDEFCVESKSRENDNVETSSNGFSGVIVEGERPKFQVEKSRNDILDSMPTMAGQNRKLMTLDSPDLRLIPNTIIPKQQMYTYSTNALRARVFRQGFRGRRNFHGPRFTSFNPYYNNTNEYFSQQSSGGSPALFQAPQLSQMMGGADFTSVARGVMQIASALWMNLPQNNMNNGLLPYNPRPRFPMMNPIFRQFEPSNSPRPHFHNANPNFSYNEGSNMNHHSFNVSQRSNSQLQGLFDMPQQRSFGTPNHIRFPDDSNSPLGDSNQPSQNFNIDLSQSSDNDFVSNSGTPPIRNCHSASRNFRNNRAANFRSRRGRFRGNQRQVFHRNSQRNSQEETSRNSKEIDPAYLKPDIPISGKSNCSSQGISGFIPISSSTSNQKPVEIISIDENDDFVPIGGISNRFSKRKRRKRKLMRLAKRKCLNLKSDKETNPVIVFLDSPVVSKTSADGSTSDVIKQENNIATRVKTETEREHINVKQEEMETSVGANVKQESAQELPVKIENVLEKNVKTEKTCAESNGVRVKVEQGESGQNMRVEINIDSSGVASSNVSLPLENIVKEEQFKVKSETIEGLEIKTETVDNVEGIKTEGFDERESKDGILEKSDKNIKGQSSADEGSERTQVESMDTSCSESERTEQIGIARSCSNPKDSDVIVGLEEENDKCDNSLNNKVLCRTELTLEDITSKEVSSWAEIKKNNYPLHDFQDAESQDEAESNDEDEEEIRPLLRPNHCKTIGTVLSALQIFPPFTSSPPEGVLTLRISFDLYLPAEFRKAHRGLPQYRIVVFSCSEPLPSPAQLREVNSRFHDRVPVLSAVVSPGSVVFYNFSDINLPQDSTSYAKCIT